MVWRGRSGYIFFVRKPARKQLREPRNTGDVQPAERASRPSARRSRADKRARPRPLPPGDTSAPIEDRSARDRLRRSGHARSNGTEKLPWPGSPWGTPVTSAGRRRKAFRPRDDEVRAGLVEEGVEEAEESQLTAARKAKR